VEKIVKPAFAAKQRLREDFSIEVLPGFFLLVYSTGAFLAASALESASIQGKKRG
jgi:hypothetical protein